MDFRKGQWNVGDAFDLNKASDLIDDKMAKNLVGDLKRQIGPEGFPKPRASKDGGPLYSQGWYTDKKDYDYVEIDQGLEAVRRRAQ